LRRGEKEETSNSATPPHHTHKNMIKTNTNKDLQIYLLWVNTRKRERGEKQSSPSKNGVKSLRKREEHLS